jgi:hypothetical protein
MAYTQSPGRGNNSKTGHGIPTPFRQEIELTKEYEKGKKKQATQREKGAVDSGLNVDKASGYATAKSYEKTYEAPSKENAFTARIKDSKGNVVKEAKAERISGNVNPSGGKYVEALKKEYEKSKSSTESMRSKNKEQYNATGGGTKPDNLSEGQKNTLVKLKKANKV